MQTALQAEYQFYCAIFSISPLEDFTAMQIHNWRQ
jgi:hypothetical protein